MLLAETESTDYLAFEHWKKMNFYNFISQIPDANPEKTNKWLERLDEFIDTEGRGRTEILLSHLGQRALSRGMWWGFGQVTPYINTIPVDQQTKFPGDETIEKRIRRLVRWNAAAMVLRANRESQGLGGHLSTFASSASLYEVGMNWFFRGKKGGSPGDAVYFQGHAAPGIYARAFLEGRISEKELDHFRKETRTQKGLSSYPHPRLMPNFWEYPTVSMGLGPMNSIYQARFFRYLHNRGIDDTTASRVWCFLGDGETDEPEALGAISLAAREKLDNLTWVVNCNLQRLDGPVRGNGKIIQELESIFRGAGWNVIKVIWGSAWDELLAQDTQGFLVNRMSQVPDGDYQRYVVSEGSHIREHFFGANETLLSAVKHLSDRDLERLPRGGHDHKKIFAAFNEASQTIGAPTVILAKTVKGWTLGPQVESRNATHQIKKMTTEQVIDLAERLHLIDDLDMRRVQAGEIPYIKPPNSSIEIEYLKERRSSLGGVLPSRPAKQRKEPPVISSQNIEEFRIGSKSTEVSTTSAFVKILRNLMKDKRTGEKIVPIVPDEARTFGMDGLFKNFKIYASEGQKYQPVDHEMLLSYSESQHGQILEEGITEAGSMSSWIAAATSYATRGIPMLPFYIFYSMFGPQRIGDMMWAAADARAKGFLLGATAGRTTLEGEGLQHNDGHSPLLASVIPHCRVYDPTFAYEIAAIIRGGTERMYPPDSIKPQDEFYYITLYNEPWVMPPQPSHVSDAAIMQGIYRLDTPEQDQETQASILFSGSSYQAAKKAKELLKADHNIAVSLWATPGWKQLREQALTNPDNPLFTQMMSKETGPIIAVTDYITMVPDQVARFVPSGRSFAPMGTDGYGLSDNRENLRRHFRVDAKSIVDETIKNL